MCRCLMKFILFVVNLVFTLIGLALIGVGVVIVLNLDYIVQAIEIIPVNLNSIPYIVITLGAIIFLIAFSGCCGVITETKCLLITYAVCMGLLAAVKIVIAVMLFVNLENYSSFVEQSVVDAFEEPSFNTTVHGMEALLQCCGPHGPDYYVNDYNLTSPTCCQNPSETTRCTKEEAFQTGCSDMIGEYFRSYGKSFGIGLIIVIACEVLAMTFSIFIIKTIESKDMYY